MKEDRIEIAGGVEIMEECCSRENYLERLVQALNVIASAWRRTSLGPMASSPSKVQASVITCHGNEREPLT